MNWTTRYDARPLPPGPEHRRPPPLGAGGDVLGRQAVIDLEAIKQRAAEAAKHTNPGHHVDALVDSQQDVAALVAEVEGLRAALQYIADEGGPGGWPEIRNDFMTRTAEDALK